MNPPQDPSEVVQEVLGRLAGLQAIAVTLAAGRVDDDQDLKEARGD